MNDELVKASVLVDIPIEIILWMDEDSTRRVYAIHKAHEAQLIYAYSLEILEQLPKGTFIRWERNEYVCRILDQDGIYPESGEAIGYGATRSEAMTTQPRNNEAFVGEGPDAAGGLE